MKFILLPFNYIWFIFYYAIYIVWWKNLIKRLIRMITGSHEIERNVKKYKNYFELSKIKILFQLYLEKCVVNSRELVDIHKNFKNRTDDEIFPEEEIQKITNKIIKIKFIKDEKFNLSLAMILNSYNNLISHRLKIRALYKETFDPQINEHREILFRIWENLKKNREINLIDKKWCKMNYINLSRNRFPRTKSLN